MMLRKLSPFVAVLLVGCASVGHAPLSMSETAQGANKLLFEQHYAESLRASREGLRAHPDDPVLLAIEAESLDELGMYDQARPIHDAVLALIPYSPHALANACWTRALANVELDQALRHCNAAVKIDGDDFKNFDTRGFLHLRRHEYKLAKNDYSLALRLRPMLASSLYGRGLSEVALGSQATGEADMARAIVVQRDIGEIYSRRGLRP